MQKDQLGLSSLQET